MQASALGGGVLVEDIAHLPSKLVGDFHTDMRTLGDRSCLAGRGDAPHLGRRQRA